MLTFLLTDIEGSTRLWEQQRAEMARALETHDALLRTAVEGAGGAVAKSTGDGLLAVFEQPGPALGAAVAGQLALDRQTWPTSAPLRVRMALHSGTAERRDNDYFGPTLNRVARLLAIGHGGQVLVSAATGVLAADELPPETELLDLGEHALRDLDRPERVYQLAGPTLRREFPALRSVAPPLASGTELPAQTTSFVGRERELAGIRQLLGGSRLVTLVGMGGTGKTRLMLEAAGELAGGFVDGARLVELAALSDPALLVAEIARDIGAQPAPDQTPIDSVLDFLRSKQLLLLLDNCEHLIEAAAEAVHRLLGACPRVTIMATSREPLGVDGESVVSVPSLSLPPVVGWAGADDDAAALVEQAAQCEAVRLFAERARATLPSFTVDPGTVGPVVEICRRLDGIPLAIELAAARVNVLSVAEIARGLDDRFRLLTGGRRTAMPRQRTLQALVDWSWDLLGEPDRRTLRRLSVFAGGWTLEAAAAVTSDGSRTTSLEALDSLGRLVDRSMVVVDHEGATRYRMLETIRQYSADQLVASGEAVALRERHLDFYARLADEAATGLAGPEMMVWLTRLDAEVDNLRTALDWAFETAPETALRMCLALGDYWRSRAAASEGLDRLGQAAEIARRWRAEAPREPESSSSVERERAGLLAHVLAKAAWMAYVSGHQARGARIASEATTAAREAGHPATLALTLAVHAFGRSVVAGEADSEAWSALVAEAQPLVGSGDDRDTVEARMMLAIVDARAHPGQAEVAMERLDAGVLRVENLFWQGVLLQTRGRVAGMAGRTVEAERWFREAEALYVRMGDRKLELSMRSERAHVVREAGRLDEAETLYQATIRAWRHLGDRGAIAHQLECFGFIARARAEPTRAARLFAAAEALREVAESPMRGDERERYESEVERLRRDLDPAALQAAWAAGRSMTVDQAVAFAVSAEAATPVT